MSPATLAAMQRMQELAKDKPWNRNPPQRTEPPPLTPEDREDIRESIDERAAIQEYDGGLPRAGAEREAKAGIRVYRYRLIDSKGWCTLISPQWSLEEAKRNLRGRYDDRLVEVVQHESK